MTEPHEIKRTQMPDRGLTIITVKRPDPHTLRPFETFTIDGQRGVTASVGSYTSAATALLAHEQAVRANGGAR